MWSLRSVGKLNVGGGVQWAEPEAAGVSRTRRGGSIEGLPAVLPSLRPQSARSGTPDLNKPIKVA